MPLLFIIDLLTLLPLFLVGGSNALWWILITACIGVIGMIFSLGNLREAVALAQAKKRVLNLPVHILIALGSILLILPGFISDLGGLICLVVVVVVVCTKPYFNTQKQRDIRGQKTSEPTRGRVIDIEYDEVTDNDPTPKP